MSVQQLHPNHDLEAHKRLDAIERRIDTLSAALASLSMSVIALLKNLEETRALSERLEKAYDK